ncbi:MAG: hypothetical protein U9O65_07415 [Thermotogota bacterium]|nr:hypothetical protein [Thermotogota bacterium]
MKVAIGTLLVIFGLLFIFGYFGPEILYNVLYNFIFLWPIILIFIGMGILSSVKGLKWLKYVNGILIVCFVAFLVFWPSDMATPFTASMREEIKLESYEGKEIKIIVESAVGELVVKPHEGVISGNSPGKLSYTGPSRTSLEIERKIEDDVLILTVKHEQTTFFMNGRRKIELELSPAYSYEIETKQFVTRCNMDLSVLKISKVLVNAGIINSEISLSRVTPVELKMNAGIIRSEIKLATEIGANFNISAGIKTVDAQDVNIVDKGKFTLGDDIGANSNIYIEAGIVNLKVLQ